MRRKFWQRNKTESGSDAAKALEQSNPYVFKDAVADVHNNHGGGDVWIMKRKTRAGTPTKKGEMDVALFGDILDTFAYPDLRKYSIRFQDSFLVLIKWRRVVRETPIILAMDAMPTSFLSSSRISSSFPSSFDLPNAPLGLPITFPFARAAAIPSLVRSEIRSRSISANRLNMVTITFSRNSLR